MVYPVDRTPRNIRPYRKQAFDGVGVPSKEKEKTKKSEAPKAGPVHQFPMQQLVPIETQPITFDPNNDIDMIDDRTQTQKRKTTTADAAIEKSRWASRASDVSKSVDPAKIAEKLLDLPVTLQVRDIAGSSREVASSLIDMLKLKKVDTVSAASITPTSHLITSRTGSLIRLQMECNFKPVTFIVDTGSQLNIISEKVCKNIVRKPINTGEAITMNDANGGTGRLLGLVEDIPLKLGHVTTPISAYVAENPPFDGLLGRPWQQAHKIGIEEREDGTYLMFPATRGYPKSEMLVISQPASELSPGVYTTTVKEQGNEDSDEPPMEYEDTVEAGLEEEKEEELPELLSDSGYSSDEEDSVCTPYETSDSDTGPDSSDSPNSPDTIDLEELDSQSLRTRIIRLDTEASQPLPDHLAQLLTQARGATGFSDPPQFNQVTWAGPSMMTAQNTLMFENTTQGELPTFLLPNALLSTDTGAYYGHIVVNILPLQRVQTTPPRVNALRARVFPPRSYRYIPPTQPSPVPLILLRVIIGQREIPFLLDTGSQVDCIRTDVFQALGGILHRPRHNLTLVNANGKPISTHGSWRTAVTFGSVTSITDLHIVDNLTSLGILGQPWQRTNRMWFRHFTDGTLIGVQSQDGRQTHETLITMPPVPPMTWGQVGSLSASISEVEDGQLSDASTMDLSESEVEGRSQTATTSYGRSQTLPTQTQPTISDTPESTHNTDLVLYTPQHDPWKADFECNRESGPGEGVLEGRMYRDLLVKYAADHKLELQPDTPSIELPEVVSANQMSLSESWRVQSVDNQELLILKNILVKVDGRYREGHAALHILYFPHTTERMVEARIAEDKAAMNSTESLVLSSDDDEPLSPTHRVFPRWVQADLEDFIDELEDHEIGGHAQRWRLSFTPEPDQERPRHHATLTPVQKEDIASDRDLDEDYDMLDHDPTGEIPTDDEEDDDNSPPPPPNTPNEPHMGTYPLRRITRRMHTSNNL